MLRSLCIWLGSNLVYDSGQNFGQVTIVAYLFAAGYQALDQVGLPVLCFLQLLP